MNRNDWLAARRRAAEAAFDTRYAPTYDEDDPPTSETHRRFVNLLLDRCPADGLVLDAACGTGKYFGLVLDACRRPFGVDQSAGMLARAAAKFPDVPLHKSALQDLDVGAGFDAAMCVDAMENVPPEDWPLVLERVVRAVGRGGGLYVTVECTDPQRLAAAYTEAGEQGLPVVVGEDARRGGGYHHYPALDRVRGWLRDAGVTDVLEAHSLGDHPSYSYHHFLGVVGPRAGARSGTGPPG